MGKLHKGHSKLKAPPTFPDCSLENVLVKYPTGGEAPQDCGRVTPPPTPNHPRQRRRQSALAPSIESGQSQQPACRDCRKHKRLNHPVAPGFPAGSEEYRSCGRLSKRQGQQQPPCSWKVSPPKANGHLWWMPCHNPEPAMVAMFSIYL